MGTTQGHCEVCGEPLGYPSAYLHSYTSDCIKWFKAETKRLRQWIHDCQSGMYINCVYCGYRYGPADKVRATMQEALYEHIASCPKHPLSQAKQEIERLRADRESLLEYLEAETERWAGRNADRYWQTMRILGLAKTGIIP